MNRYLIFLLIASFFVCAGAEAAAKKVLYVASYHMDKGEWTAGIKSGIDRVLSQRKDVVLELFNMDTRLSRSEEEKEAAARKAHGRIGAWKPDIVIISDDNAAKYLLTPYYRDADLPFVFCGLNWDASVYGLPFSNATGMIEVQLITQIITHLERVSNGSRIGILRGDTMSNRKEQHHFEVHTQRQFTVEYVKNFTQWKRAFVQLQKTTDMIVFGSLGALDLQDNTMGDVRAFIMENTRVPTAAYDAFMKDISLVTLSTIPEEQGEWAAGTALQILDGRPPTEISMVKNKKGKLYLNMGLARLLNVKFPMNLIERSHMVRADRPKLFYVNSYHKGYQWSDDIEKGLFKALGITRGPDGTPNTSTSQVDIKLFRMDTKLNRSERFIQQAALAAKKAIDEWQPDIVVTSDDNAVKYLVSPFFRQSTLPFVFCGVNWDASVYGLPLSHITGMVEVSPIRESIEMLRKFSRGDRVGVLGADNISNQKEMLHHERQLAVTYTDGQLVSDFRSWKKEYLRLQSAVDMLIFLSPVGIADWDDAQAWAFILENTRIPSGASSDSNAQYTLLGLVRIAAEQGWWAGKTAMAILNGKPVSRIPVSRNTQFRLLLNAPVAKRLKIKFPLELIEQATLLQGPESSGE